MVSRKRRVPRPAGKATVLNEATETAILEALRNGSAINHAAAAAGINPSTYFDWLRRAENAMVDARESSQPIPESEQPFVEFAQRVQQARAEGAVRAVELIRTAAKGGSVVRETHRRYRNSDGEAVEETEVTRAAPDWRAAAWWLERAHRQEFGKNILEAGEDGGAGTGVSSGAIDELARRIRVNVARLAAAPEITAGRVVDAEVIDGD